MRADRTGKLQPSNSLWMRSIRFVMLVFGYPHCLTTIAMTRSLDSSIGGLNMTLLKALGSICGATTQLPHTTILSDGLKRCGDIAVASGGFTGTWRGWYWTKNVILKAFVLAGSQEAGKVRHTILVNVPFVFGDPHRSCGRGWSYGRGCPTSTPCRSLVSTRRSLRLSMTGRTLKPLPRTQTRTRRTPYLVSHSSSQPLISTTGCSLTQNVIMYTLREAAEPRLRCSARRPQRSKSAPTTQSHPHFVR